MTPPLIHLMELVACVAITLVGAAMSVREARRLRRMEDGGAS